MNFGYVPRDSIVHRLDPRVKLVWFLVMTIVMTTWLDPIWVLILYVGLLGFAGVAQLSRRDLLRGLLPALPLMTVVFVINLFMHEAPGTPVFLGYLIPRIGNYGPFVAVDLDTLVFSTGLVFRILVVLTVVMIFMKIMSPLELAVSITKLRFPAEVGMAFSIAFAYVPVLIGQITEVLEAQQSRGWQVGRSNPFKKVWSYLPVVMPTFFRSYVASEDMAAAMLSRGFGFDMARRTEMRPLAFDAKDKRMLAGIVLFGLAALAVALTGYTNYHFTLSILKALFHFG